MTEQISFEEYLTRLEEELVISITPTGDYKVNNGYLLCYFLIPVEYIKVHRNNNYEFILTKHPNWHMSSDCIKVNKFNAYVSLDSVLSTS